jgi:hydrogenase expression/formation protein HypD
MKFVDEFRDARTARAVVQTIAAEAVPGHRYRLMEFCGGHTHALFRFGLLDLLPPEIEMVHGPGCPVCVLPVDRIDGAIALARIPEVLLCSYGDMLRVPGSGGRSLLSARAQGANVQMVLSTEDALELARRQPGRQVVLFAIGFETTTPPTAVAIQRARAERLPNFSVYCNHVLTPSAIISILESPQVRELGTVPVDGFVGPAHVSTVIGWQPYEFFAAEYGRPVVIAGFEPLDILRAILMLVRQLNDGRAEVENEYTRAVTREGNAKAKRMVAEVFELRRSFEWRGLGLVPWSALRIKASYAELDAERRFALPPSRAREPGGCECGAVLRGMKRPTECKLFATACTPEQPVGACMVSPEGACAAYYAYGRHRAAPAREP